jgi:hypothetical protein
MHALSKGDAALQHRLEFESLSFPRLGPEARLPGMRR